MGQMDTKDFSFPSVTLDHIQPPDAVTTFTTAELIEELKGRAEAYGFQRSALGFPGIEFWFLNEEWDHEEKTAAKS